MVELYNIYKYFSHHMRNSTAMIAASVTLMSFDMVNSDDDDDIVQEIIESSYLLDLFDAGMGVCFAHTFGENFTNQDSHDVGSAIEHFIVQCKGIIDERNVNITLNISSPLVTKCNIHTLSTIINIIIYEAMLQTTGSIDINITNKDIIINSDGFESPPVVWVTFKSILLTNNVFFTYDKGWCKLEFNNENTDC